MARIYRAHETSASSLTASREMLEEFPDEPLPTEIEEEAEPEEEQIDTEALREAVLAEAREEAARKVKEAYQEGLRRGEEAGEQAFRQEVETAALALDCAAQEMQRAREEFLDRLEGEVVDLTCGILERILDREMETDTELCTRLARRALEALVDEEEVRLRVNPIDRAALRKQRVQLLESFPALKRLQIEEDEKVQRGGCVAETPRLRADFQPRTLLDNLCEEIFDKVRESE